MNEVPRGGKPHVFGLVCLALLGAGALVLGPALRGEFTNLSDRRDVLEDDRLAATARGDVGRAFELSDPRTPGGYRETPYAPLASLSSALDLALWEDDPVGHHATNLVLLLATAGLLAALVWRWTGSAIAACVALGLAVLHPLSSGTAAWISGRGAVLAALFLAGSLLLVRGRAFALRHVAPRPGAGRRRVLALGGAGALFACALLSDPRVAPLALLFPVVAVAFGNRKEGEGAAGMRISDCGLRIEESAIRNPQSAMERGGSYPPPDNGSGRPRGRELFQAAIFLLVALGAAALVFLAAPPSATLRFPDGVLRGLAADAAGAGWTVLSFLFPANLTVAPDLPTGAGVAPLLAAVVLLVLGAVVSLRALARGRIGPFARLAAIGALGATLSLAGASGTYYPVEARAGIGHGHVATLFLALVVAAAAGQVARADRPRLRAALAACACVVLASLAGLSWTTNEALRDSRSLWEAVLAVDPSHPLAHRRLGEALLTHAGNPDVGARGMGEAQIERGIRELETAATGPSRTLALRRSQSCLALAAVLAELGRLDEAEGWLDRAAGALESDRKEGVYWFRPDLADLLASRIGLVRGQVALGKEDLDAAEAWFREARRAFPENYPVRIGIAYVLERRGKSEEALQEIDRIVELAPHFVEARLWRGRLFFGMERYADAFADFEWAADRAAAPGDRLDALLGQAKVLWKRSGPDEYPVRGRELLEEAVSLSGVNPGKGLSECYYYLAAYAMGDRRWNDAFDFFDRSLRYDPYNLYAARDLAQLHITHGEKAFENLVADFRAEFAARHGEHGEEVARSLDPYWLFALLAESNPALLKRLAGVIGHYEAACQALESYPDRGSVAAILSNARSELALLYAIQAGALLRYIPENPKVAAASNEKAILLDPDNTLSPRFQRELEQFSAARAEGSDEFHELVNRMVEVGDYAGAEKEYGKLLGELASRPDQKKVILVELAGKFYQWAGKCRAEADKLHRDRDAARIAELFGMYKDFLEKSAGSSLEVLAIDPENDLARRSLAVVYHELGETDRSVFHYEFLWRKRLLTDEDRKSLATLYLQRGSIGSSKGRERTRDERIADLERHVELATVPSETGQLLLARLLAERHLEAGRAEAAATEIEKVLKKHELDPAANLLSGRALLALKRTEEAVERLDLAAAMLLPDAVEERYELARAYREADQPWPAYVAFKTFADQVTYRPDAEGMDGDARREWEERWAAPLADAKGFMEEANEIYRRLVAEGEEAASREDWALAAAKYGEALLYNPEQEPALLPAIGCLIHTQEYAQAELLIRRLVHHHPDSEAGLLLAGQFYWIHLKDAGKARRHLEKLLKLDPDPELAERAKKLLEEIPR